MELQALLVLCGVGVAGVAVLLLMSLFSSSGTSYEEAIAQQRKAATELLALAENKNKNNKKNNKKAIKKQAKKEKKEIVTASTGSDHESEAPAESGVEDEIPSVAQKASSPHVDFTPAVVVDVSRDAPIVKIRKRGKDPKVKPILVNKEDPSCVSDPTALAAAPSTLNHFEETHPKDEFELLHSTLAAEKPQEKIEEPVEKKEAKAPKAPKAKGAAPKPAPAVEAVKEEPRERRDSGDAPKEQRKAKKAEKKLEKAVEEVSEVVPPLNVPQPSELTTEKLLKQALVEAPVQAAPTPVPVSATVTPSGGKKKKKTEPNVLTLMAGDSSGVNVGELERVIRAAPLSDTEIQILTEALLNKHHDPLPKHSEWTEGPNDPMQKLKKQLAEKEKALADEIDASKALHAKLKEMRASLNAARHEHAIEQRASEERHAASRAEMHTLQARVTRLMEEHHILQQKLSAEGEAQAQRVQMEMHIQRLSETEAALLQQIAALQAECNAHALDATAARDSCIMAQQHANEMAQQLQEANRACNDLEQQRQLAVMGEQRAQQEVRAAQERLAAMSELQNEVQRLSSRSQVAEANAEKIKEEAEKQKQQLASEVASLSEQLAAREAELAELKILKATPAQNGLPTQEQHKGAELAAVESVVEALREELSAAQRASLDQREQLNKLNAQLKAYQDKNNELRTKNWKVMEALQSAEKALQSKATAMPVQDLREAIIKAEEAQYAEVASLLRAACPTAAPGSAAGRDWLRTFADNLKEELRKRESEKQDLLNRVPEKIVVEKVVEKLVEPEAARPDPRLAELQTQNKQLQAELDKYKGAINYTEEILSRLQQNVSSEEARWKHLLDEKQRELDQLRTTTMYQEPLEFAYTCIERSLPVIVQEMQSKIDELESQLEKAKATNHNHSFADAERQTEERLLAGLSEKLAADVCNGPSQIGLEEK